MCAENQPAAEVVDHAADMKVAERSCPYGTTERPDQNIAVRRQREVLMVHEAGDPAEEFPLRTPSEMACHQVGTASVRPTQSRWPRSRRVIGMP